MARDTGKLLQRAVDDASAARDDLRRARGDVRRYRGKAAKTRARNRAATAERKLNLAVARVDKYATVAVREERTAVARGESAKEWEVGLTYEGSSRQGNAVDVNFRLFKSNGALVEKSEAVAAIRHLHRGGKPNDLPFGMKVEGVNWQRPNWNRPRNGRVGDLNSFSSILQTSFMDDFRLGAVEEDE